MLPNFIVRDSEVAEMALSIITQRTCFAETAPGLMRFSKLLVGGLLAVSTSAPVMADALSDAIATDYRRNLERLYVHLHQNPEISWQEQETSELLARRLRGMGFQVTENVGGSDKFGVVGVYRNGRGPTVLIRADTDALPVTEQTGRVYASTQTAITASGRETGVMHACGHDVHMTAGIGAARQLIRLQDQWKGTLIVIFQPAEEVGGGAKAMLEDGLFERFPRPDYNIALHVNSSLPAGSIGYAAGYAMANVDSVDVLIRGKGGHGAYPHGTIDPVVIASQIVLGLQTIVSRTVDPLKSAVVTVGAINGGTKRNIIGDEVLLQLTVRSYEADVREHLLSSIERIAHNIARASGVSEDRLPVVTEGETYTPATYNSPGLASFAAETFQEHLPRGNLVELPPTMGGEDFGRYGTVEPNIPSFMFNVGAAPRAKYDAAQAGGPSLPTLHSPFFYPDPSPTIRTGTEAMTRLALGLFTQKPKFTR